MNWTGWGFTRWEAAAERDFDKVLRAEFGAAGGAGSNILRNRPEMTPI